MPKAKLPTTPKGWLVALGGSFVGLIAGFVAVDTLGKLVSK